ncbi:MAG: PQQ-binding-like beta-propeller repeat protein [Pirellulaceae bacterium]
MTFAFRTALLSLLFLPALATADDWPRWMGPGMDGVWGEMGILEQFSDSGAKIDWRVELGGGYAGPAVASGHVYVMDRTDDERGGEVENDIRNAGEIAGGERVLCLNAKTGEEVWSHTYDCPYSVAYPTGPRCTPTVDGDHVYTLGAMGDLICFRADSGEIVWQKKLTGEYETKPPLWGYSSHPLVDGEQLLVPVGGEGTGVVSFNKKTGEELWRAVTTMDVAYAPLVIYEADGERQLVFWHADGVTSLDPGSGKEYWTVKFPEEQNASQTSIATPRIVGDRLFISEYYKGSLLLQIKSNPPGVEELWRSFKTDPKHETGLNSMMATPVISEGHVYGIGYNGRGAGILRCLEMETGEMKWTEENWLEEEPVVFATAFIVSNHDRYFMFNDNGELMIALMTPEGFEEIDRASILEPTSVARGRKVVWSHPAFSDKHMFARNDKEIVSVDLSQGDN